MRVSESPHARGASPRRGVRASRGTRELVSTFVAAVALCGLGGSATRAQTQSPPPPAPAPVALQVGHVTFTPGGYVKADGIFDFDPIGSTDSFNPLTIPVDDSEGRNVRLHARQSRLSLDVRGDEEAGGLHAYVEMDFFEGSSYALRLRHAYGEWGPFLAGRAWSLFVDEDALPNTIDFESTTSFPQVRQAQFRFTQRIGARATWAVSVEDPAHALVVPEGVTVKEERIMPDVIARVKYKARRWHLQTALFTGAIRSRAPDTATHTEPLLGVMVGGKTMLGARDTILFQVSGGDGLGRFRGVPAGFVTPDGDLHALNVVALMTALDHRWDARFVSTVSFGVARDDAGTAGPGSPPDRVYYSSANLIYWFLPARAWVGAEYLFGRRDTSSGGAGNAHRLQVAFKFLFQ